VKNFSNGYFIPIKLFLATIAVILLVLLSACTDESLSKPVKEQRQEEPNIEEVEPEPSEPIREEPLVIEEPKSYTEEATLIAVGDIMTHSPQLAGAYNAETKSYSFDSYFTEIQPFLSGDWVIGNLETTLAGVENRGFSGYPQFNSPDELADALKNAGFNILTTANNHSMDRREKGVLRTLEVLNDKDILAVGTYSSQGEADQILVVTKNDISMAILSYTYGTNGILLPAGKEYLVNLIDEDKLGEDIRKARELGVDVVTVALHMHGEYHRNPNDNQKKLTQHAVKAGADIILGSHPHVVQPYEIIETLDENGISRQGLVIYSLGNFISNQGPDQGTVKYTDVGVVFEIVIQKHYPEKEIEISAITSTSTWVHKYWQDGKRRYRILPIESILASKKDSLLTENQYELMESYLLEMNDHIEAFIKN
jgi:poly-gamma-glutamate capsule biosynthesis protein CapA/YwtB (metallophosphatase superfamily)